MHSHFVPHHEGDLRQWVDSRRVGLVLGAEAVEYPAAQVVTTVLLLIHHDVMTDGIKKARTQKFVTHPRHVKSKRPSCDVGSSPSRR